VAQIEAVNLWLQPKLQFCLGKSYFLGDVECLKSQKKFDVIPTATGIPSGESGNLICFRLCGFPFSRE